MSRQAKLIRNHVAEGLRAAPELGMEVYESRHRAIQRGNLPAVVVTTGSETVRDSSAYGAGARKYERVLELMLVIHASTSGRDDDGRLTADDLDDLAERAEAWMFERETNNPVWVEALLKRVETGIPQESDEPTPVRVLVFDVLYFDQAPKATDSELTPLESIHVDHDLAPSDGQVDASDTIPVPQP